MSVRSPMVPTSLVIAAVLAVMTPVMKGNGAYSPVGHLAASGHPALTIPVAYQAEPDPTDQNSVIIECVALGNRVTTGELGSKSPLAGVPILSLGPSPCWPQDQN